MFKKYTCKWRVQINNKIEKHFKGENYFLAFGVLLKYYRDNNFFDEDLDYVVDGNAVNVLKNLNKVKGLKLISEGWCENFPIIMKFKYRNKTIIDFFFLNNINGNLYVCCRKPYLSGELQNIPKDKKEYNKCETFIAELFHMKILVLHYMNMKDQNIDFQTTSRIIFLIFMDLIEQDL